MIRHWVVAVLLVGWFIVPVNTGAEDGTGTEATEVTVEFVVTVPGDTPTDDTIYISGNHPGLGTWNGKGLALTRDASGVYHGALSVKAGAGIQCKVTRGSWATVEKAEDGREVGNRSFRAAVGQTQDFAVAAWAVPEEPRAIEPTQTGHIELYDDFPHERDTMARDVIVYLPPGYADDPERAYPVLYMHDGQNIFDASTSFGGAEWRVDEAAEQLITAGSIEPIIIVGIYNTAKRMEEYNPLDGPAGGTAYTRFVVDKVMPFIEKTYRVDPARGKTGIAGSSLGGLISLYMAKAHADQFGRCAVVSPSLGYLDRRFLETVIEQDKAWLQGVRIWVDMGTAEAADSAGNLVLKHVHDLVAVLEGAGLKAGEGYRYEEVEGGRHSEQAWADRIEAILTFLYGH